MSSRPTSEPLGGLVDQGLPESLLDRLDSGSPVVGQLHQSQADPLQGVTTEKVAKGHITDEDRAIGGKAGTQREMSLDPELPPPDFDLPSPLPGLEARMRLQVQEQRVNPPEAIQVVVRDLNPKGSAVPIEPERLVTRRKTEHQDRPMLAQVVVVIFRPVPLASPLLKADVKRGGKSHARHRLRLVKT